MQNSLKTKKWKKGIIKKEQKGITLIALVITIIVLMILAGVAINTLNENNIMENARVAVEETNKANLKQEIQLALLNKQVETKGSITEAELRAILGNFGEVADGEDGKPKTLTPTGKDYTIEIVEIWNGTDTPPTTIQTSDDCVGKIVEINGVKRSHICRFSTGNRRRGTMDR